jgi:hypothetical protein
MGEAIALLFIFVAVMSMSLVLFTGWAAAMTVKGVIRMLGLFAGLLLQNPRRVCSACGQTNPGSARFCRRCGQTLSRHSHGGFLNWQ